MLLTVPTCFCVIYCQPVIPWGIWFASWVQIEPIHGTTHLLSVLAFVIGFELPPEVFDTYSF